MEKARWFFPFKFKLTLVISTIVLLVLVTTYHFVKTILEDRFTSRIQEDLVSTQLMVQKLFDESFVQLINSFQSLSGHGLIKELFTDPNFDQATRDDLVQDEIFRYYQGIIDVILLADSDGRIIAGNKLGNNLRESVVRTSVFHAGVNEGQPGILFLFAQQRYFQLLIEPYFQNEAMIGIMVLGNEITSEEMIRIREISNVDLGFLKEGQVFLCTPWRPEPQQHQRLLSAFNEVMQRPDEGQEKSSSVLGIVQNMRLLNERFLYVISPYEWQSPELLNESSRKQFISTYLADDEKTVATRYVMLKSLDHELAFLSVIMEKLILTGVLGVGIALVAGLLFSLRITRPIGLLQKAAQEVKKGDLSQRLEIDSHDEFHQLGTAFNDMVSGLAEKERVRAIMNKVVSAEIATEMLAGECHLGGEEKQATILFSDIRGFTTLSEGLPPTELLTLLNRYFTQMSACVDRHRGVIDKYIGDAIMALYGVPKHHSDDALNAVLSAREMLASLADFNQEIGMHYQKSIEIGIGINTGKLVAGNMGAENRLNYTVLGDEVNLASRLEGLCKLYGVTIIISEATWIAVQALAADWPTPILVRELDAVQVKGKTTGIKIYQVFAKNADSEDDIRQLIAASDEARVLFFNHQFNDCYQRLKTIQERWPDDGPTRLFLKRCQRYQDNPALMHTEYANNVYIATGK